MSVIVHQWYSLNEAIASFGGEANAERYCDNQFVVMPKAVLCFVTLGVTPDQPQISTPSRIVWRPGRVDYHPSDEIPWLPLKVREVYDRSQNPSVQVREHHVFLRNNSGEPFTYAGPAHLGSYGTSPKGSQLVLTASFSLNEALPREIWLKFGGYTGWQIDVNHVGHSLDSNELKPFEALVSQLTKQEFSHLGMTRYEEDSLSIYTNAKRGWLMYLRFPADEGLYTRDLNFNGSSTDREHFECTCGIDLDFPTVQTLPRELAIRAVIEFFQTGVPPKCMSWEME